MSELTDRARAWAAEDPDEHTRAELEALVTAAETDPAAAADLADRFDGRLEFGTAGLRGALGAGPNRMNRVVVIRAAAGLAAYLLDQGHRGGTVVVGYDARHNSDVFAEDTAAVMVGAGLQAVLLPRPLPTPVLAYAIRVARLRRRRDGHRVAQPAAGQRLQGLPRRRQPDRAARGRRDLGAHRRGRPPRRRTTGGAAGPASARRSWSPTCPTSAALVDAGGPRDLTTVYTPLHGVGGETVAVVMERAGFPAPHVAAAQAEPDPDFPTVAFPNPEEPGAMDLAMALAAEVGADVVVANDPDADRCAVAVPDAHGWRMLRGDEVGALLGDYLLRSGTAGRLRELHRVLDAARQARRGARPAARGDAHRLQVDRPGRGPRVRLRGGARLLRRARAWCATRTASRRCCSSWTSRPGSRPRAAR